MSEAATALTRLLALMARLRDPQQGCPWDREQTFASIAPFTLEEAYEVADAIERGTPEALREELGDLLFQVVFHARMAQERGWFDFSDVARAIHDKLVRRHPHVFAGRQPSTQELHRAWEDQKASERAAAAQERTGGDSTLAGVPLALPALSRAVKLSRRAARVGFDWSEPAQVRAKVLEELAELDAALAAADQDSVSEELGDLLFAICNWGRHMNVDPETALRAANNKFERRFERMEELARARGQALPQLSARAWDALWNEAKLNGG